MTNNKNTLIQKVLPPLLFLALSLHAGTYDEKYLPLKDMNHTTAVNENILMQGEFKEIIRFNMLSYNNTMDSDSKKTLESIIDTIRAYQADSQNILVSIIGHTNAVTDDANERTIDSDTYANQIQNWFRSSFSSSESKNVSKEYALDTQKALVDAGIDANITQVEYRGSADLGFTDETGEGKNLSNRVMVTIYVLEPADIDSDTDGVLDMKDKCPNTPLNAIVDASGCPLDGDMDGVVDYNDKCPQTPAGVSVDKNGCPLDSDKDGVVDYKDECLETPTGVKVDLKGCPVNKTLALHFNTGSDKIEADSSKIIEEFAKFMKNNPAYNVEIIGHTDSVGKAEENIVLSQKRAQSTKSALVANGVEAKRISTLGRGELEPLQSNRTQEGREANRRIEVKLSY